MKKKQIVFLFLLILLLLVFFSSKSFAFTCKSPITGVTYDIPDLDTLPDSAKPYLKNGYFITVWSDGNKNYLTMRLFYDNFTYLYLNDNKDCVKTPACKKVDIEVGGTTWANCELKNCLGDPLLNTIVYSSVDIYSDVNKSSVFIKALPIPARGVVQAKVEQVEMRAVLQEILGILPMILSVLVSLIALRKGWFLLLNILRKA